MIFRTSLVVLASCFAGTAFADCGWGMTKYTCYTEKTRMDGCYVRIAESKNCALTQVEAATHCTAIGSSMWWNNWLADTQVITCPDRPTQPPAQATASVCNMTSNKAYYATMIPAGNTWNVEGWWEIASKGCVAITIGQGVYVTAQGPQGTWGDTHTYQCVNPNVRFSHPQGGTGCPAGEVQRGFHLLKAGEIWNLGGL